MTRRKGRWPICRKGTIRRDARGYLRIWLGKGHPFANSGGWQYLHRYLVMADTRERLRHDEHVHHVNGKKADHRPGNLEVQLAEYHGRYHATVVDLMGWRDDQGRFVPHDEPRGPWAAARAGAVIGPAAKRGGA